MKILKSILVGASAAVALAAGGASAETQLYNQNFENPNGFVNDGGDINIVRSVDALYGLPGFVFSQPFTTETLLIGGTQAFGVGYTDPAGVGGNYAVGFLSSTQDDLLGLAFDVGAFNFLNVRASISSIDLDRFGGPFVPTGTPASVPIFRFSLYDNPSGAAGLGSGGVLDSFDSIGLLNPSKSSFLFSNAVGGLDASGSTNGNVILRIDLLQGGYGALDNLRVSAADVQATVPEPGTWALMIGGFGAVGAALRRRRSLARA